jgi:hypothetical protein
MLNYSFDRNSEYFLGQYLTFWGLIVSAVMIFMPLFFKSKIPLWVFISGASILTGVTVVGTFFNSIIRIVSKEEPKGKASIIAKDSVIHILPLMFLILIFTPLVRRTKAPTKSDYFFRKNYKGRNCSPIESNYFILASIPALIFAILYTSLAEPEVSYNARKIDIVIIIVLLLTTFCSSYHIYFSWSQYIIGF